MLLYLHGFASCGDGQKSRLFKRHFGAHEVVAPDLPTSPRSAVTQLQQILARQPIDMLVGSSLGGHYATWLNRDWRLPTTLINPVLRPDLLLKPWVGWHENWCDQRPFELTNTHIRELAAQIRTALADDESYLVLLQSGDEVLDHTQAARFYRDHRVIIQTGGNHRFENLADYLPEISAFYRAAVARP